jgi:hypothetical protein
MVSQKPKMTEFGFWETKSVGTEDGGRVAGDEICDLQFIIQERVTHYRMRSRHKFCQKRPMLWVTHFSGSREGREGGDGRLAESWILLARPAMEEQVSTHEPLANN